MSPSLKILFLDLDFVLNSRKSFAYHTITDKRSLASPDVHCVALMDFLLFLVPDLYIVVSSSWRNPKSYTIVKDDIEKSFGLRHYNRIIDQTPFHAKRHRGTEIYTWLHNTKLKIDKYVIVDDDADFLEHQLPFFVQTDENGFSTKHLEQTCKILGVETVGLYDAKNVEGFRDFCAKHLKTKSIK